MSITSRLSRRHALTGFGLLTLGTPALAHLARASVPAVPRTPNDSTLLDVFVRMRSSPDGATVRWIYSGVLVGKLEGEVAVPLTRIEGMSRTRAIARSDGAWDWHLDEAGYYCDLASGQVLEQWLNPLTGHQVAPVHYRSAQRLIFRDDAVLPAAEMPPGAKFRGEITQLASIAGILALTEDLYVSIDTRAATDTQPARPRRLAASLATFTTTLAQLAQPRDQWVDCQFTYTTLNSFVGWLGMSDMAGIQNMRLVGVKCRVDDDAAVPTWLRERLTKEHPDLLNPL